MPTTYESRRIAAPVGSVWAAIADLEAATRWNRAWRRVEYLSDQREGEGTAFRAHTEDGLAHDFTISAWVPLQRIAFAPVRDEAEKRYMITLESQEFHLRPEGEDRTHVSLFATAAGHGPRGRLLAAGAAGLAVVPAAGAAQRPGRAAGAVRAAGGRRGGRGDRGSRRDRLTDVPAPPRMPPPHR